MSPFSLAEFIEAAEDGSLCEFWADNELPTFGCPRLNGLAINAVWACHKVPRQWLPQRTDSIRQLLKAGATFSCYESETDCDFITFLFPRKPGDFIRVPIDNNDYDTATDHQLIESLFI